MIDLHVHSTASDGNYTVPQLLEKATHIGLTAMAITDHDTVDGVLEYESLFLTKKRPILIPGIELSVDFGSKKEGIHILGYLMDYTHPDFKIEMKNLYDRRYIRNEILIENLQ